MIRLGTRRSALALAQSQRVADALSAVAGEPVELVPVVSEGDVSRASLSQLGGTGVFATRLREALLAGECDLLVHSLKDLPTAPAPGLVIAAIPAREDARDVVVTRDGTPLHELPAGSVVGTGSPRRIAQLRIRNHRVEARDIRGNIDSRLARVKDAELDAVVLAAAGLARLGAIPAGLALEPLGLAEWPSAAGQGALAVETRDDAPQALADAIAALDDAPSRVAVAAERAVLETLEAGCHAPVGVHAELEGDLLRVRAVVYALDGSARVGTDRTVSLLDGYARASGSGNGAKAVGGADPVTRARRTGDDVARELLDRGAADVS
ncbi:hydroxymethylbilane synthase [Microbacterium sp. SORGH_AS_0888]|uniref:hydroxymethylbilane synthase n=1 Tax=Microbacterium sp. SORGH_AS_0888 TaxID=3041791 RepID=UPI0027807433|nr:hydroxymethylbilane synthase [Microbacterium sp. SORGH_AS_0888]MDQ1129563.1 hydroxymethylbilane synthase [Microbacterium sp. SORGH_AS_0888]